MSAAVIKTELLEQRKACQSKILNEILVKTILFLIFQR